MVQVAIDITKALRRGVRIWLGDSGPIVWADLRYKWLSDFCYRCAKIGHIIRECFSVLVEVKEGRADLLYGDWLRISGTENTFFSIKERT